MFSSGTASDHPWTQCHPSHVYGSTLSAQRDRSLTCSGWPVQGPDVETTQPTSSGRWEIGRCTLPPFWLCVLTSILHLLKLCFLLWSLGVVARVYETTYRKYPARLQQVSHCSIDNWVPCSARSRQVGGRKPCCWLWRCAGGALEWMVAHGLSSTGLYVLVGAGVLMMVLGFFGCCGAMRESQCVLGSVSGLRGWAWAWTWGGGRGKWFSGSQDTWPAAPASLGLPEPCCLSCVRVRVTLLLVPASCGKWKIKIKSLV
jgi:hypothetical protein